MTGIGVCQQTRRDRYIYRSGGSVVSRRRQARKSCWSEALPFGAATRGSEHGTRITQCRQQMHVKVPCEHPTAFTSQMLAQLHGSGKPRPCRPVRTDADAIRCALSKVGSPTCGGMRTDVSSREQDMPATASGEARETRPVSRRTTEPDEAAGCADRRKAARAHPYKDASVQGGGFGRVRDRRPPRYQYRT